MSSTAIKILVVAIVIMFGGATVKALTAQQPHDPDNFTYEAADRYATSFALGKCKEIKCRIGKGNGTLFRGAYEVEEGWVFVYGTDTPSGETHVLFPAEDPQKYRIVEAPAKS
jgi:hypothetical protein